MDFKKLLINLDVKPEEAKLAQLLFENGPLTPTQLSKHSGINRVTIYEYLKHLSEINLVTQSVTGKRKQYALSHPRVLKKLVTKRKEKLNTQEELINNSFGELIERFNATSGKPGISWFDGIEGIQTMLLDYAEENISGSVVGFSNTQLIEQAYTPAFLKKFIKKKITNEITGRYIVAEPDIKNINIYFKKYYIDVPKKYTPKIKYLNRTNSFFDTEINIYDDKISFIKIKPPAYFGVIIKSAELAQSLRIVFNYMWETLE